MNILRKLFFVGALVALVALVAPMGVMANNHSISVDYVNPLTKDSVEGVLVSFLDAMQGIVVTLAIVFIVIGALLYIFSAGDEGRLKLAKGAITAAIIGLALAIAAPSFLREIYIILAVTYPDPELGVGTALTLLEIVKNVLDFLLGIAGTLAIIMLIVGGLMYLTASGDEKQIDTGKSIFKASVIGIIFVMAALLVVTQVATFFG